MNYLGNHVIIACIISAVAFVVAGYWQPLPGGLIPSDMLIAGGLFYFVREAVTSKLADKAGWQYPLAVTVALATAGRFYYHVGGIGA